MGAMAVLHLKAKPGSRTSQLFVAANGAVTARLAATFGLPKRSVTLRAGHTAPFKKVALAGLSDEEVAHVLARLGGPAAKP